MMARTIFLLSSLLMMITLCAGDLYGQDEQRRKQPGAQGKGASRLKTGQGAEGGNKALGPNAVPAGPVTFITDPEQVDAGFAFLGEYSGEIESSTGETFAFGAQVAQTGKQGYRMRGYVGGLPGAGWDDRLPLRNGAARGDEGTSLAFRTMPGKVMFILEGDGMTASVNDGQVAWAKREVRESPTAGLVPPPGAEVLFGGGGLEALSGGEVVAGNLLRGPFASRQAYGDHKVHLEFRLPYAPDSGPKQRGMNHVLLQGRYGLSIKDSIGLSSSKHVCGALIDSEQPRIIMSFPPLSWQTYDIEFRAARFDPAGQKTAPARVSIWQNGVLIHDDLELAEVSEAGRPESPEPGPLEISSDGCPIDYRNIWVAAS